ncbi:MAG TPA: hypothetical protein DFI00_10930 [Rhodospirillaceae bacterium]|nr:hypothetical protein [Alphaproteobacteria bacterium]HCI47799.1 hypothetical protein [Rhodospirillaceae bacterium]
MKMSLARPSTRRFCLSISAATAAVLLLSVAPAEARDDAERLAKSLGREMAAAKYCQLDPSRVEVLTREFNSQISGASESRTDFVKSQQLYYETLTKYQRREPSDGCDAVISRLQSPEQRGIDTLNQRMKTLEDLTIRQLEALKAAQENQN